MRLPASVCVYCGSSAHVAQVYRDAATSFGGLLGRSGIRVVYGGGRVGLMGLLADAALAAGGEVTGIIPRQLQALEVAHQTLTKLHVVETMHERKEMMAALSDGFVVLPGGLGTLDETFEILTWRQLGLHRRPIVVANLEGFWDPLLALMRRCGETGFIRPGYETLFREVSSIDDILPGLVAQME